MAFNIQRTLGSSGGTQADMAASEDWNRSWNTDYVPIWSPEVPVKEMKKPDERTMKRLQNKFCVPLPAEILRNIFGLCLRPWSWETFEAIGEGVVFGHENQVFGVRNAPLSVSHVCSDWRALALASRELWANPYFHIPYDAKSESLMGRLYILGIWLRRSGDAKLSLNFCIASRLDAKDFASVKNYLSLHLVPEFPRIVRLNFNSVRAFDHLFFKNEVPENVEELILKCDVPQEQFDYRKFPCVKRLSVATVGIISASSLQSSLWSNLTELNVGSAEMQEWRNLMSKCTKIRHTSVKLPRMTGVLGQPIPNATPQLNSIPSVRLDVLRSLTISILEKRDLEIFKDMYLPSLDCLDLRTLPSGDKAFGWTNSAHFLSEIGGLKQFRYRGSLNNHLINVLTHTPSLTHLEFAAAEDMKLVLDALANQVNGNIVLLPSLKVLEIQVKPSLGDHIRLSAIVRMLEKRYHAGSPLSEFRIGVGGSNLQPVVQHRFKYLHEETDIPLPNCSCVKARYN